MAETKFAFFFLIFYIGAVSEEIKNQIIMYGADWCPDCRRAKAFLDGHGIHYQFIDVDKFP